MTASASCATLCGRCRAWCERNCVQWFRKLWVMWWALSLHAAVESMLTIMAFGSAANNQRSPFPRVSQRLIGHPPKSNHIMPHTVNCAATLARMSSGSAEFSTAIRLPTSCVQPAHPFTSARTLASAATSARMSSCSAEFSTLIRLLAIAASPVGPSLIWRLRSRRLNVWLEDSTCGARDTQPQGVVARSEVKAPQCLIGGQHLRRKVDTQPQGAAADQTRVGFKTEIKAPQHVTFASEELQQVQAVASGKQSASESTRLAAVNQPLCLPRLSLSLTWAQ